MSIAGQLGRFHHTLVRTIRSLGSNLLSGFRFALPFPHAQPRLTPSLGQFVIALLGLWILSATDDLIDAGLPADFSPWGILSQATQSYFWIATLAIIVAIDRRASQFLLLGVAMASVSITVVLAWMLTTHVFWALDAQAYRDHYRSLWWIFLAWETIVFARVMLTLCGARWNRALLYAITYGIAVYSMASYLPHRAIFIEPWDPAERSAVDVETTYYAQPNLLRQSLYALSPQRPGVVDLYFVGFGAYAFQDVFQREVEQATVIFEQRFNAIGRTVQLINNLNTINSVPLANRHNLARTVRDLARRIDPQEDIVVLFLSSHGAEDGTISVDLSDLGLNDLSAVEVRQILDENSVKWRIIIVSACYSGSFIDALASPSTLVITAASADRSSFGCSHENEWTYFGEAYFEQALRESPSFVSAFELAQAIIARRESDEGKKASQPQISVGAEIAAYLSAQGL